MPQRVSASLLRHGGNLKRVGVWDHSFAILGLWYLGSAGSGLESHTSWVSGQLARVLSRTSAKSLSWSATSWPRSVRSRRSWWWMNCGRRGQPLPPRRLIPDRVFHARGETAWGARGLGCADAARGPVWVDQVSDSSADVSGPSRVTSCGERLMPSTAAAGSATCPGRSVDRKQLAPETGR